MNDDFAPLVSIIIPVYKGANFLAEAIDSALAQTYPHIEVLVVNDGSPDQGATERIALSYGDRIRYFSKPNGGVATALNMGIEQMRGEYFSWLSHDDLYLPEKVANQIALLEGLSPDVRDRSIVYSDFSVFSTDASKDIYVHVNGPDPRHFRYWITTQSSLHGCSLLIPKKAFETIGIFNPALRYTQDYDLWFLMAAAYDFRYLPEKLVKGRQHAEQDSVALSGAAKIECTALLQRFVTGLTPTELQQATHVSLAEAYARLAHSMWYRGFSPVGWQMCKKSLSYCAEASAAAVLSTVRILISGMLISFVINPLRPYLSPALRRKIKNLPCQVKGFIKPILPVFIRKLICRSERIASDSRSV